MTTTPTPDNPHTDLLAEYDERSSQIAATDKAERRITDVEAFLADTPEAGWESAALAWRDRAQTAEAARDRLAAELAAAEETAAGHGQMRADLERLVLDLVDRKIPGLIAARDRLAARVETLEYALAMIRRRAVEHPKGLTPGYVLAVIDTPECDLPQRQRALVAPDTPTSPTDTTETS